MSIIIDVNIDVTAHLPALKNAGVATIFGYLDPIGPGNPKAITPARAQKIAAAGLRLGLVSEGWGDFAHSGISAGAGERDGLFAAKTAPTLGAAADACIYFAVDADASTAQIGKLVIPYFAAVRAALPPPWRVGVYGSGNVCAAVLEQNLADRAWLSCSMGWGGSKDFLASNKWALRQYPPSHIYGIPCDRDISNGDFGDFVPFARAPAPAPAQATIAASADAPESILERIERAL